MSTTVTAPHTTRDLARRAGISYRQADYWSRLGYLVPARPATGQGSRRCWCDEDVAVACVFADLMRRGLWVSPRPVIRRVVATLRDLPPSEWGRPLLLDATGAETTSLPETAWVAQLPVR